MDKWEYTRILGSGSTSYIFEGLLDGVPVALKWMNERNARREIENINEIRRFNQSSVKIKHVDLPIIVGDPNLLLPLSYTCGRWFLEDIVGEEQISMIKLFDGPRLIKDRTHHKHKLIGTSKHLTSCLLVFPLVEGDLEKSNLKEHDVDRVTFDIKRALEFLHAHDPPIYHDDLALRNIFYYTDRYGDYRYLLGDFGKIKFKDFNIDNEIRKIRSLFL